MKREAAFFLIIGVCAHTAAADQSVDGVNTWKLVIPTAAVSSAAVNRMARPSLRLTPKEALLVGRRIWQNEAGGKESGLTHWTPGERFASLGVGHFIWYPLGMEGPFVESFPPMAAYLEGRGVKLPDWIRGGVPCPWDTREEFYAQFHSARMKHLRQLLADTVALQAEFTAARLEHSLPAMLATLTPQRRAKVERQFFRVARSPGGIYPLVDYVNFKGEGVSPTERYQGQGWGLLQVLENMKGTQPGPEAVREFADSAASLLRKRVRLSPARRHERRWLAIWLRRIRTYNPA